MTARRNPVISLGVLLAMLAALLPAMVATATSARATTGDLVITGVVDGPLTGGVPKAIEVYVVNNIADLSIYGLGSANNGGGSDGEEFTFPAVAATAGDFIYVASESTGFTTFFGFAPDYTSSAASINGDDAIELFMSGGVVDVFGDINTDGTGQPWEYLDGWAYRTDGTGQDGTTFILGNWTFSGPNALDGETSNGTAATPFPIGTYSTTAATADPVINEFVANHTDSDTQAFVEVFGDPSTDYSALTVLEIEGDSTGAGVIDAALPVGTTNASGYWVDPEDMENGTLTILLVENFSGSVGTDLDTDNDGTFDSTPWTRIVDDVATSDGFSSDVTYSATVLDPFFDSNPFGAGGASRIPNGTDTDAVGDWVRNDFDGFGFPSFPGSPAIGEAENTPDAVNVAISVLTDPVGVCNNPATLIHDIQEGGALNPDTGNIREIEGIVTGDFEGATELRGFFMQEETGDFDGDGTTSEGIFVFNNGVGPGVVPGNTVRVRGTVAEFNGLTELNNVLSVTVCTPTGTTAPASWSLPVSAVSDWEWVEGMEITISQTLHASGNFTWARFGEVDLSINGPLDNPTNVVAPGAPANALQDLNNRSRIQLDDGSTVQNPLPFPPYLGAGNTLRTGDTIPSLTGNLSFSFGNYEIHPTVAPVFTRVNGRPGVPSVGGTIEVAAYNVLNYFTTLDNAGPICGPLGNQGCRGADNAFEFGRQRAKLVDAISQLDAEVVGLMEIENYPGDVPTADLVAGLNAATSPGKYAFIATGAIGSDAIRQAVLYQPAAVTPLGGFEVLDSTDDSNFDDTRNRPMVVQSFVENATGAIFTVGVNHLKSKGSPCLPDDPDAGDGQGNCNVTRTKAAQAIVDFLATDPTGSGDSDFLIIGDLNAYAQEDPVTTIEAGGYTDLIEAFHGTGYAAGAYSFNFFSQSGYLDHGLASGTMTPQVAGAAFWHVNADEPSGLDYNNFNQPGLYNPDEFRSSDHDPVIIGLNLDTAKSLKEDTALELSLLLPTGDTKNDKRIAKAIDRIEESLNPAWWTSSSTLDAKKGRHVFDRERMAVKELMKVDAPDDIDAQAAIDQLLEADRQLAQVAITAAILGGGDQGRIDKALARMAQAADAIADGKFDRAVGYYKKAWQEAIKAT